jgi:CheY-like chemotaxis protein
MTKQILTVDDSRITLMMIEKHLSDVDPQWQVIRAENGDKALEAAAAHKIDAFTVDYNMPGMNGIEVITKLRESYPDNKIILLTSNIQSDVQQQADELNARVFNKPVLKELVEQIVTFLNED